MISRHDFLCILNNFQVILTSENFKSLLSNYYISEDKSTMAFYGTYQDRKMRHYPTSVLPGNGDIGGI